jgi:hypothetical protein
MISADVIFGYDQKCCQEVGGRKRYDSAGFYFKGMSQVNYPLRNSQYSYDSKFTVSCNGLPEQSNWIVCSFRTA